jgi:membrane fusion protein, multidrug efflux system
MVGDALSSTGPVVELHGRVNVQIASRMFERVFAQPAISIGHGEVAILPPSKLSRLSGLTILALSACSPAPPPAAPPPPKVSVVTLKATPVPITTELPGRVAAFRVADVRPQVNGIILKRLFVEGSEVKAGQQLYQIDPALYQAAYDTANATLLSAHALAQRYKILVASNAISKQDYDNALAADLSAKAGVETAHINLVYTKVLSPISGRSSRSAVTEGALVTANQATALATVQQLDMVYVDVTQPSGALLRLKREAAAGQLQQNNAGQTPVRLRLEDDSDYTETGTLQFSEVTVDEGTGSVILRAVFPNPQRLLLPGMFVHEEIEEGVRRNALLVPQLGVSHNQKGEATALIVGPDNVVQLRVLETDRAIGDMWLVTDGLKAGDRVIVEGLQIAQPGGKVDPQEYRPTAAPTNAPSQMHRGNTPGQPK